MEELSAPEYEDIFSVKCPPGTSMVDVVTAFFFSPPKSVKILMGIRNSLVSVVGLKTGYSSERIKPSVLKSGSQIGLFEIASLTPDSALIGADDSHLNFRIVMNIRDNILSCRTQVHFNNALGRVYFSFVKPFHKLVVPAMLNSSIRHLGRPQGNGIVS